MSGVGRNTRCVCGSGRKAKRCCGVSRGPGPAELAAAFLAAEARTVAVTLRSCTDLELEDLFDRLVDLPRLDLSLLAPLPELVTPELERLRRAIVREDEEEVDASLEPVLARIDTPALRAALARNVLALRRAGRLDTRLAAAAVFDLAGRSRRLVAASLLESLAVSAGAVPTPGGVLVAAA